LSIAILGAALLAGCQGGASTEGDEAEGGTDSGPIKVGEFGSLTGSEATFGQSTHAGIMLAVEEQNAAGGVKGRMIEVITYDDQGKSQEAGGAVTRLITDDKVVAVLGEVASSLSLAGGEVAQQYGVPMISPSSTNPDVTKEEYVFRACYLDTFQGQMIARFGMTLLKGNAGGGEAGGNTEAAPLDSAAVDEMPGKCRHAPTNRAQVHAKGAGFCIQRKAEHRSCGEGLGGTAHRCGSKACSRCRRRGFFWTASSFIAGKPCSHNPTSAGLSLQAWFKGRA
jgi:hypothetical protein